ncbi:MAG: hypothetical protein Q9169_006267 [Polycauliona sp. 2 TL-2023]
MASSNSDSSQVTTSILAPNSRNSHNVSFPITSAPVLGNSTSRKSNFRFGCTPDPLDNWHDARSCSCQTRLYNYYGDQSTADTTFTVCHTSGEESYGLQYSTGCSLTTSPLLMTPWVAPDDCCGYCKIEVPEVRIVYWSPETVAPNATHSHGNFSAPLSKRGPVTAVEDGFTFTSPSVYIVYTSISASASCIAKTQSYHTVGGVHMVTRAYDAEALSTVRCVNSMGVGKDQRSVIWEAINYNDLYYPIPMSASLSRIDRCFSDRKDNEPWGDWMKKPFISLPKDVSEIDPAWSTCSGVKLGAMDPPHALVPAAGFEDSSPSEPANPPSADPITQIAPSLPKATPGKTIPEAGPGPTGLPMPMPETKTVEVQHAPETDQSPISSVASPVRKDPASSLGAPHPIPQRPSPDPPIDKSQGGFINIPSDDISPQHPVEDNDPNLKEGSGEPVDNETKPPNNFDAISSALFPPSANPGHKQKQPDNKRPNEPLDKTQPNIPNNDFGGVDHPSQDIPPSHPELPNNDFGGFDEQSQHVPHGDGKQQSGGQGSTGSNQQSSSKSHASSQQPGRGPPGDDNIVPNPNQPENGHEPQSQATSDSQEPPNPQAGTFDTAAVPNDAAIFENPNRPNLSPSTFAFVSSPPPPIAGNPTISRAPNGAAVIGDTTIQPGEAQIMQGTPISLASDPLVIGPSSHAFLPPGPSQPTRTATPIIEQGLNGEMVVGTTTIAKGDSGSINGHHVSVGRSDVYIDGKPFAFPASIVSPTSGTFYAGGLSIAVGPDDVVIVASSTLFPGAEATISGHLVSHNPNGVLIDGISNPIPTAPTSAPLLIDGATDQKAENGNVVIGPSTITPGNAATIDCKTISVAPNADAIIINSKTYTLPPSTGTVKVPNPLSVAPSPAQSVFTIGDQTFTANPTGFSIASTSILPLGHAVTVSGTVISLGSAGLVIGSTTVPLASASATAMRSDDLVTSEFRSAGYGQGTASATIPAPTGDDGNITSFKAESGAEVAQSPSIKLRKPKVKVPMAPGSHRGWSALRFELQRRAKVSFRHSKATGGIAASIWQVFKYQHPPNRQDIL